MSSADPEKAAPDGPVTVQITSAGADASSGSDHAPNAGEKQSGGALGLFRRLNNRIENLAGFEARGITRVLPSERQPASVLADLQVAILWFGANISANNMTTGLFGPLIFNLSFRDSVICALLGCLLGASSTAYMSIWGPQSGNRTMVALRFFMGYWPSKLPCLLNIVLMLGYITLNFIISGQILSAVSGGTMTVIVGIVVVAIVCWIVAVFGMWIFHSYERYAWIPQLLALFVLIGAAGHGFDADFDPGETDFKVLTANRLSFLSLCLYVPQSWAAAASDYYVYYPERTRPIKIFALTLAGLFTSFALVYMIGIGLASGVASNPAWEAAFGVSTGALILEGYGGLGGFGKFCGVIVAMGIIANSIPGTYSAALGFQVLGRWGKAVPRWVWTCFVVVVELACALAGRDHLLVVFGNFLALMGYWVGFMIWIVLTEHFLFRGRKGFDWSKWEDKGYLPVGVAALVAFLLGWVGAILGMYQAWYTGVLAEKAGGSDIGFWVGSAFTLVSYPPMRFAELKMVGR